MQTVFDALYQAGCLVLATPLYWFGMSAQVKRVIDRMYASVGRAYPITPSALLMTLGAETTEDADAAVTQYRAMAGAKRLGASIR